MNSMTNSMRCLMIAAIVAFVGASQPASAITAELAKKCRGMALKAHPTPRVGKKTGAAKAQQDFYRNCVAKNGNIE